MNLGNLVNQISFNKILFRTRSPYEDLETANGIFKEKQNLYGTDTQIYYVNLINLLDRAITENNLHCLSTEQQELFEQYLLEANSLTRQHTSAELQDYFLDDEILHNLNSTEYKEKYSLLNRKIQKLDEFLGSWSGVENEQYSRYSKEQFHSKRKPISQETERVGGA